MKTANGTIRKTVQLHPMQAAFKNSPARRRGFVGGRGSGKSWVGAYDLITRAMSPANKGRLYLAGNNTYGQLNDTTIRSFKEVSQLLGVWDDARFRKTPSPEYRFPNGSEVLFRSADNESTFRGPNLSGVWLDEASLMDNGAYLVVIGCLREKGHSGWISATFTPRGKLHWTYEVFGKPDANTALFHSSTRENPFIADDFEPDLRKQYISSFAAQELGGEFIDAPGKIFNTSRARIVEYAPADADRVRYWDKASLQGAGDFTAGVLMAKSRDGIYYVEHVERGQYSPLNRNRVIERTAGLDSRRGRGDVKIWVEQEPGSGGKESAEISMRELSGYSVHCETHSKDKVTRAMHFAAQMEAGNVHLVSGDWNPEFLDELNSFPGCKNDDQVDAGSGAFNKLANRGADSTMSTAEQSDTIMGDLINEAFR